MEGKKLVVDEGGNKRSAISEEDLKQALNDITEWFKANANAYYKTNMEENKGANQNDIEEAIKVFGGDPS